MVSTALGNLVQKGKTGTQCPLSPGLVVCSRKAKEAPWKGYHVQVGEASSVPTPHSWCPPGSAN